MDCDNEDDLKQTLLVFNCHEPWVHLLSSIGFKLDIITGLKGGYSRTWDMRMRPQPANSRLITLEQAIQSSNSYYCIITHNTTDLIDIKTRSEPRLIVLHSTLEGRAIEEKSKIKPHQLKEKLHKYLDLIGGHAVATSMFKGESWGFTEDIVHFGVDPNDYMPYTGDVPKGLRICNFISSRKKILLWDLHEKAFAGIPVQLVGHNPDIPGVNAADNWGHLKKILQSHRFYIHTADPRYESGFNIASIEAMAAGMPILCNRHPTNPIRHGVCGFVSDNPKKLHDYARMLLEDHDLAILMGKRSRQTAIEQFSLDRFNKCFRRSIEIARQKWYSRHNDPCDPDTIKTLATR